MNNKREGTPLLFLEYYGKTVPVDSVGLGDRRGCDECKELLESEQ
jgi:hypothetical protein